MVYFSCFIEPAAGIGSGRKQGGLSNRQSRKDLFHTQSQSFIAPSTSGSTFEQLQTIENELLKSQMQKEEYENELNKIPNSFRRAFAQRDRKKFLEESIESLSKKINEAKLFIRKKKMERERSI